MFTSTNNKTDMNYQLTIKHDMKNWTKQDTITDISNPCTLRDSK